MSEKIYTVSEITHYIELLINDDPYLTDVQIVGEITDLKERSGHLFFTLKDESASITCVFFGGVYRGYLQEGSLARVRGDIRVYPQRGLYRLLCEEVHLLPIKGSLFLKLKQTYERLLNDGVFEKPKKPIPRFPNKIGVITSRDSAAYQDILRTTKERFPAVKILLFHTRVQGEEAKESLLRAIEDANNQDLDVIVIARGGGASDDLWVFNDEEVVRAVFRLRHPVVTGIGHQIDTVLVDLVADYSAHTPTAAMEYILPDRAEILYNATENLRRMKRSMENLIQSNLIRAQLLSQRLKRIIDTELSGEMDKIKFLVSRLFGVTKLLLEKFERDFELLGTKLTVLNPEWPLLRGYTIISKENGKWVKSSTQIVGGERLMIKFSDGVVKVIVDENR